jgi:hypothetical protein
MLKRFQSRPKPPLDPNRPTRWLVDENDAARLGRVEQSTLSAMVAGCTPERAQSAVVRFLAGENVCLESLEPAPRRRLTRMLDSIREAANANIDPELVASVCADAMDVGRLLREAYTEGFEAGKDSQRRAHRVH